MNLPNQLTVARLVMALCFVGLMSVASVVCHVVAYGVFIAATITDYYDGKIARQRNLVTNFGKLIDPVADKVLILGAFIMLMYTHGLWIPPWTIVVIMAREFLITGARAVAATSGHVIAANIWGKTKAVIQMVYVFTFLFLSIVGELLHSLKDLEPWMPRALGYYDQALSVSSCLAIVLVAVFTIYSGVQFMHSNWRALDLGGQL